MTRATISIVSHGHGALLEHLLRDLSAQQDIDQCTIVLTLNLADEPFEPSMHLGLTLTVLRNQAPKGFGANHNAAFCHCIAPLFLILNPDIRLADSQAIARLVDAQAPIGLRAPRITNLAGKPEDSVRRNLTPWSLMRRLAGLDREPVAQIIAHRGLPFIWFAGMFLVVDADAFRHVNGFDERLFLYCEDYDLCARLYNAGYELRVSEEVQAIHDAQRDSHRKFHHLKWHIASLVKVWTSAAFWRVVLSPIASPKHP